VDCSEAYIIRGAMTVTKWSRLESNIVLAMNNAIITRVHDFDGLVVRG
jgi:hypothetical protein